MDTRCYSCEAPIIFAEGKDVCRCNACGRFNSRPKSEKQESDLMKYANERRNLGEFDKAEKAYDEVLKKNLSEHEARWGILLCRRGAIYLENKATNTVVITCRKKVNSSIVTDPDFKRACEDAPIEVRCQYERDAKYIDAIQREIRAKTDADACDIFICYKETEPGTGERTEDSVRAMNVYQTLTRRGYRVFYAPVSLKKHLGANYEAAIFNAIETAQVMLVLGTKPSYFATTWMQSEWRRFLEKVVAGEPKLLVPLYQNFSPGELPTEFADRFLQGLDMSDVGFMFDLEDMLNKVVRKANKPDELTKPLDEVERMEQSEEEDKRAEEEDEQSEEAERKKYAHVDVSGEIKDSWQEIFAAIDDGTYKEKYECGNTKLLDFGKKGQIHMQIVAFDTDVVSETGKKAPITWIGKELLKNKYRMNPSTQSRGVFKKSYLEGTGAVGGWEQCELRKTLGEIYIDLPDWLRERILLVSKEQSFYTKERGEFDRDAWKYMGPSVSQKTDDYLWIPSYDEIFGGSGYPFFANRENRIKTGSGIFAAVVWWLRSASSGNDFYAVVSGGYDRTYGAQASYGVALGFCT